MYNKKNVTLYDTDKYVAILGEVDGVSARKLHVTGDELKIGDESIKPQDVVHWIETDSIVYYNKYNWNDTYNTTRANSASWDRTYTLSTQFSSTWDVIYNVVDDVSIMSNASAYWDLVYNKHTGWDNTSNIMTEVISLTGDWDDTRTTVQDYSASWEESADIANVVGDVNVLMSTSADWDDTRTTVQDYSASWEESADINIVSADVSVLKQDRVDWDQNVTTTTTNSAYWRDTHLSVLSTSATWDSVYNYVQSSSCLLYTSPSPRDVEESRMPSSA